MGCDQGPASPADHGSDSLSKVQRQFGRSARDYATSEIHAAGESLGLLLELTAPRGGRLLDVGAGAGHTAMAFAPFVDEVVASDVTEEMLSETKRLAVEREIVNLTTASAAAESLPFADAAFDLVTCRLAFHHFSDQPAAMREMARVLEPGGLLAFTDNVTVADDGAAAHYNRYESIRDPSHNRVLSLPDLLRLLETGAATPGAPTGSTAAKPVESGVDRAMVGGLSRTGLLVESVRRLSKEMEFQKWADRQRVGGRDKERLLEMMRALPPALEPLFRPRWADGTMYFSLWEAVVVARKT